MNNPSPKIRDLLYSLGAFNVAITIPVLGYLVEQEVVGLFWVGLAGVINAGIFLLAKSNVEK